jgi:peptide/nickel transport system substrate-binding protein
VRRYLKLLTLLSAFAILAAACGGDDGPTQPGPDEDQVPGGTLRLGISADIAAAWDPAKEYEALAFEVYRCCLSRTLISFSGTPGTEGGNEPLPDLAAEFPEESEDGLTWTFKIKEGLHYAPPFQDTEIVAGDFVRSIERLSSDEAAAGGYPFYYSPIEGFDDADGEAGAVTGMEVVDDHTLAVHLTEPVGDLPFRFTMPATTPMPEGTDVGHVQDYGRFLVSSGPYMFEGSEAMDFSVPAKDQKPVAGYQPGKAWLLVRNPTWVQERDSDDLRPAWVDRIEVTIGGTPEDNHRKVETGDLDLVLDGVPPAQEIRRFQSDPQLKERLHVNASEGVRYLSMNLAIPPFDDVQVRKAMNYIVDKDALRRARGGPLFGELATHSIINSLENDLLADYDPFETPNGQGDLEKAKEEMRQSKYDTDQDGICDAPECKGVLTIADSAAPYPEQNAVLQDNAASIGIELDIRSGDRYEFMYAKCQDPAAKVAFCPSPGWFKDYSDAVTFGEPLFQSTGIGSSNYSLVGASPELLADAGYEVTEVPSADDKIEECKAIPPGDERIQCWVELDRLITEEIVPWIPWLFDNDVDIAGERIVNYTYDQSSGLMSLDHVSLEGGGAE